MPNLTNWTAAALSIMALVLLHGQDQPIERVEGFAIPKLNRGISISTDDRSLGEWVTFKPVLAIDSDRLPALQFRLINGRSPRALTRRDIAFSVYMAFDAAFWYVALEARDDIVRAVGRATLFPYSGDCLEVFLAGRNLESRADMHNHVTNPGASRNQAAFLQLDIPAFGLSDPARYLQDWRTDATLRRRALATGLRVTTWRTASGWAAEVQIPFAAFESDVQERIRAQAPLKLAIDYVDYDGALATRNGPGAGFNPDNVMSLDREQERVSVPGLMRRVVFQ